MDWNTEPDFTVNDNFDEPPASVSSSTDTSPLKKSKAVKRHQPRPIGCPTPAKRPAPSIYLNAGFKWNLQSLAMAGEAVSGGKSPVSALNELGVRVQYTVLRQGGPAHCPSFTVSVKVADMSWEGCGQSKREARASAARKCLQSLLVRAGRLLHTTTTQDFTSDEPAKVSPAVQAAPTPTSLVFGASATPSPHKSPINTLYETYPGITFDCTYGDGTPLDSANVPLQLNHSMRFKVVCCIKNLNQTQTFEGYGSSKKLAKLAAARAAVGQLSESCPPGGAAGGPAVDPGASLQQGVADVVARLVNEKFAELMRDDVVHSRRKVLAGIVITVENEPSNARVIAVTTGTKCVSGEHMSTRGRVLNDCHAEVAARRCLQRHLYAELFKYACSQNPSESIPESDLEPVAGGGYRLRPDRRVHLYVSTAPCGDGRIFSPHDQGDPEPDRHPNRLARGQLRTKIESGEGTIPVKSGSGVQTWDGVLQGERLLTMSCSDKVARWCVLGLQGALLARFLRPVYPHSLVLGSLLHPHHMYRAICGRFEGHIDSLPPPFRLQRPLLARAASAEARVPARAPSFSVSWCATSPTPEIVNSTTGKLETGQPSLLCKQTMFGRWQYLARRLPPLHQEAYSGVATPPLPASFDALLYNEAKALVPQYQIAKDRLFKAFTRANLGQWVRKPIEQDQFVCELHQVAPEALFA